MVLQFFSVSGPVLGAFGDSMTTSPSYAEPLANLLGRPWTEDGVAGYKTADLLPYIAPRAPRQIATDSVLLIGANDVIASVAAATIEANITALRALLHSPVSVCILPFANYAGWTAPKEAIRVAVNAWIVANIPDFVDAEAVMAEGNPPALKAVYDSGDGLHPNTAGYAALAQAIYDQGTSIF